MKTYSTSSCTGSTDPPRDHHLSSSSVKQIPILPFALLYHGLMDGVVPCTPIYHQVPNSYMDDISHMLALIFMTSLFQIAPLFLYLSYPPVQIWIHYNCFTFGILSLTVWLMMAVSLSIGSLLIAISS